MKLTTEENTVQFAILDQSTRLWALPVAKLKGIPNNPSNKTLGLMYWTTTYPKGIVEG